MTGLPDRLAEAVRRLSAQRSPCVVGIDGPDAAGKTTLADRLAGLLGAARVRGDGFLHPREHRYRRGELSPEGCYRDSFDDAARFGSAEEVERRYRARYLPAQELYRAEADPETRAHVLVDNEDVTAPRVPRWRLPGR
ncbi:hypothetical protein [Geodermatophilus sp. SYSU D00815]